MRLDSEVRTWNNCAAARSALYGLLADSFNFPTPDFYGSIASGEFSTAIRSILSRLPHVGSDESLEYVPGSVTVDFEQFGTEYIRLFDLGSGRGKPPCPLYGGEYASRPRLTVMEELVRFYEFFDLALSERDRELPDHLSVELEFLHYLAFREHHALEINADPSSYRRAQADFIERHPGQWLPVLRAKLETQSPLQFFAGLVALTTELLRAEHAYLRSVVGKP